MRYSIGTRSAVSCVIVIPAFNESEALPIQAQNLLLTVRNNPTILIMDDSAKAEFVRTGDRLASLPQEFRERIIHIGNLSKSGRGAAVKRGLEIALHKFPECVYFLEADADGSHQASDVDLILNSEQRVDVLIGSRYLKNSKIEGWSLNRRLFSKILNKVIPKILNLPVNDVTNGLRRYSRQATELLVNTNSMSTGFIYLSEQLKLLNQNGFTLEELPITFKERIAGSSSVTYRELTDSVMGLLRIMHSRNQ